MDVYYHVKFQLCITSSSKVSRGVQNCTHPGIECVQTPWNRAKCHLNYQRFLQLKNHDWGAY